MTAPRGRSARSTIWLVLLLALILLAAGLHPCGESPDTHGAADDVAGEAAARGDTRRVAVDPAAAAAASSIELATTAPPAVQGPRAIEGVVIGLPEHDGAIRVEVRRRTPRLALADGVVASAECEGRRFRIAVPSELAGGSDAVIRARTEDGAGESHWVEVGGAAPGNAARTVVLELRPTCAVRARAVDASGSVVPQAEWMLWSFPASVARWDGATSEGERRFIRSGDDGVLRARVRAGRLHAFVRTTGGAQTGPVASVDGAFGAPWRGVAEPPEDLDLGDVVVGPPLAEIRVRVTDREGAPIRGAAVLMPVEERAQRFAGGDAGPRPHEAAQETDERGEVVLRAARGGGALPVAVCAAGFVPSFGMFDRGDARDREFRLRPSPSLRVRFRAGGGFAPVPQDMQVEPASGAEARYDLHHEMTGAPGEGAAALVRDLLGFHGRFRGDPAGDGVFAGHLQHGGRWTISARFPAGLVWERDFDAADGAATDLVVDLPPGRPVTIPPPASADEREARRAQNIRVQLARTLRPAASDALDGDRWSVTNAVLRLADLPEDGRTPAFWAPDSCESVTVSWSRRGGRLGRSPVRVASGAGAELVLPLSEILAPAPAPCRLRVRAALEGDGGALPSVEVVATAVAETREEASGGRTRAGASGSTGADGCVELLLAPGRYTVRISPASGPGKPVEVDVRDPERPAEITVWMPHQPR